MSKDTFVNALDGFESSEIKPEELTVFEMEEVIRVRKWAVETGITVCLLGTGVDLVWQGMINMLEMIMKIGAFLQINTKITNCPQLHIW